jgi:hypothetical protein
VGFKNSKTEFSIGGDTGVIADSVSHKDMECPSLPWKYKRGRSDCLLSLFDAMMPSTQLLCIVFNCGNKVVSSLNDVYVLMLPLLPGERQARKPLAKPATLKNSF